MFLLWTHFLFPVRHPERQRKTGEKEEGGRGGEEEELMMSQFDWQFVLGYHGNSCVLQAPESFYEDASQYDEQLTFDNMNLSRPILKVTTSGCFLNQEKKNWSLVDWWCLEISELC